MHRNTKAPANARTAWMIAFGIFAIVTAELGIVGVLPEVAEKYGIPISQAGLLVTVFALSVAIVGPFATLLASAMNPKRVMVVILALVAADTFASAFAPKFWLLAVCRIVLAWLEPVYFSMAFAAVAQGYPPGERAKSSAVIFTGLGVAMVAGIPAASYLSGQWSLEGAFLAMSVLNGLACLGLVRLVPSLPLMAKTSYGQQLKVLLKPQLWLNIAAACLLFAGMFSLYSYISEYLQTVKLLSGPAVSALLIVFGLFGIIGNWLTGKLINRNMAMTALGYPIALSLVFLIAYATGGGLAAGAALMVIWGAVHMGGPILVQMWLSSEAQEAPVLAGSLYMSFANLGVALGTSAGAWVITEAGLEQLIWCGMLFLLLGFAVVAVKIRRYGMPNTN